MHAFVFCGVGRAWEQIAVPQVVLHHGEALVSVELATICGSDLHTPDGAERVHQSLAIKPCFALREHNPPRYAWCTK
jgi:threonine dehydrogenase-like Zn-dependent dehydrogenase